MFTSQSVAKFYDKLFSALDFELPHADTGRKGFPKEAMLCAFIVMKSEGVQSDHRSCGLSGKQPDHRALLRIQYHETAAVLLDL